MDITNVTADTLFDALSSASTQLSSLANQSLNNGIDKYTKKDYKGAALDFKRAMGLDPYSDYAIETAKYLAMSYTSMGETDKAIGAYKLALKLHPESDELQTALGNIYFREERTGEAITAYEAAVRLNDDANNRFALGQGYLKAGRYDDAANQFKKVIKMDQRSPNGYFGLGQTYSSQKKYDQAIEQFKRAIQKNNKFYDAYAEMGYTYADAGDLTKAADIQSSLKFKDESLASTLGAYIQKMTQPKILLAWASNSSFYYTLPRKTPVSVMSDYLTQANSSQTFSMMFQFNKSMDRESVENALNWTIKRSSANGPGTEYNFGLAIPSTEAKISPFPTSVYYDEKNYTATVRFTISQNATANATIDPSHMEFSFKGLDTDGNTMHPKYDQFLGFSGSI